MLRILAAVSLATLLTSQAAYASLTGDNFDDNAIGPQWTLLTDDAATLDLAEQNQRLEMIANAPASAATDALYLSNGPAGFRLSTAQDFDITLDYSFTGYAAAGGDGDALALVFGVGRDLAGTDSAAVGMGWGTQTVVGTPITAPAGLVAYRTDDAQTAAATLLFAPTSGTFEIAYNAAGDDLTLGIVGSSLSYTLDNTVQGVWGADDLLVSFGGRGNGFTTTSGESYLDNFTVVRGQAVPEPASLALLILGALPLLSRRRAVRAAS